MGLAAVLVWPSIAAAQTVPGPAPDSATCRRRLTAPAHDSDVVQLSLFVTPFDASQRVSPAYEGLIGEGLRQMVRMPAVLRLDVYDARLITTAIPTLEGVYRVVWRRDGRLTGARVVGGTRNAPVDTAILRALTALDSSELLPPPDSLSLNGADSVDLRILLTAEAAWPTRHAHHLPPVEGVTRLVQLHVPERRVTAALTPAAGNPLPAYPDSLRQTRMEGQVDIEVVVGADGRPDPRTIQVIRSTDPAFVRPSLSALAGYRFSPLHLEGCPVAASTNVPFFFKVP